MLYLRNNNVSRRILVNRNDGVVIFASFGMSRRQDQGFVHSNRQDQGLLCELRAKMNTRGENSAMNSQKTKL
jgi:hypothetical protein